MLIAVTGGTGFIGRYLLEQHAAAGHRCRAWHRAESRLPTLNPVATERVAWQVGELGEVEATRELVTGCDAVVHAALYHPGGGFRGGEGDLLEFASANILGSLRLIEAARSAGVGRFVFVSTCAVHEKILPDRPLDETHPTTPTSHYGAHKAAIEQFVHSFGWGQGYEICALRPTGVYGVAQPAAESKWFKLVQQIVAGQEVTCQAGGKEVHALDVARAATLLVDPRQAPAEKIRGEAFNCYDRYVSQYEVATIARELCGSASVIHGSASKAKNEISTTKLGVLGMRFGGVELLRQTIGELIAAVEEG